VLIGGLGLGYAVAQMARRPRVTRLTVVEREADVIGLVLPYLRVDKPIEVFQRDLYDFLRDPPVAAGAEAPDAYDTVLFDIWYRTGETQWAAHVVPLCRLLRRRQPDLPRRAVWCWGDDEMFGQLREALSNCWRLPPGRLTHNRVYWTFRRGIEDLVPETASPPTTAQGWVDLAVSAHRDWRHETLLRRLVHHFVGDVGRPAWERRFGRFWDAERWQGEGKGEGVSA
jgi:hypothetical protein